MKNLEKWQKNENTLKKGKKLKKTTGDKKS
jgi:hypothetical protein